MTREKLVLNSSIKLTTVKGNRIPAPAEKVFAGYPVAMAQLLKVSQNLLD